MSQYNGFRFFSFSNCGGFDWHETLEAAKAFAEDALDCEREAAGDSGWEEDDTRSICYGEIKGTTVETARMPWKDHMRINLGIPDDEQGDGPGRFDEFVDFDMEHFDAKESKHG